MKKTDMTSGRIIQRVYDAKQKESVSEVVIVHGIDWQHNIDRLINNLFEYFPSSEITLKKLKFGYELKIKVE